jgi:flagellum-specific ATP synthase
MPNIVSAEHLASAQRFKQVYARYQQNRDLVSVGAYAAGSDPDTDFAIERMPHLKGFLRQGLRESLDYQQSSAQLKQVLLTEAPVVTNQQAPESS